jgi:hypothetical protein
VIGKLELANLGYFADTVEDYYRFPQACRFLDQGLCGKRINIGEFGVKTDPAWKATRPVGSAHPNQAGTGECS